MGTAIVLLPPDQVATRAEFIARRTEILDGEYLPTPISDGRSEYGDGPNPEWRESSYPQLDVELIKQGEQRGYRLTKVAVWPVRYDGRSRSVSLVTDGLIRVHTRPMTDREVADSQTVLRESAIDGPWGACRASVAAKISNRVDLDRWYPPRREVTPDDDREQGTARRDGRAGDFVTEWPSLDGLALPLVIITNNHDIHGHQLGFGELEEEWTQYGIAVNEITGMGVGVTTVDEISTHYPAFDQARSIQLFIAEAVRLWGTSYVILGGDVSIVPTRHVGGPDQDDWQRADPVADYWYTRVSPQWVELWNSNGDEWIGESELDVSATSGFGSVTVGRIPARTKDEVEAVTNKLKSYRLREADNSFFSTAIVAAGMANEVEPTSLANGVYVAETSVAGPLEGDDVAWSITRLYPDMHGAVVGGCECYEPFAEVIDGYLGGAPHWMGDALRDDLQMGHFAFHVESSLPDRLGRPRASKIPPSGWCPNLDPSQLKQCRQLQDAILRREILPVSSAMARELASSAQGEYSWVISSGGWTATIDQNAVGEELLRAGAGGAVGYIGRTNEAIDLAPGLVEKVVDAFFIDDETAGVPCGDLLRDAFELTYAGSAFEEARAACEFQFLGDPSLPVSRTLASGLGTLDLSFSPSSVSTFGVQDIGVTVTAGGSAVEGATVTLRQAGERLGSARTSAAGFARFAGVSVDDPNALVARAYHPYLGTGLDSVAVSATGARLVYAAHDWDDDATGDGDGWMDAGETGTLRIVVKNTGTAASSSSMNSYLQTTAPVSLGLDINGEYRPAAIFIGSKKATAPVASDVLRIPFSREGTRLEGIPNVASLEERFALYRDTSTGEYVLRCISPSASADSVFTGTIETAGGLTSVTTTVEGNDVVTVTDDTIEFLCHGDASPDEIRFRAEAADWIDLGSTSEPIGAVSVGDSTEVEFEVTLSEDASDGNTMFWTLKTHDGSLAPPSYSDFGDLLKSPQLDLIHVDFAWGDAPACGDSTVVLTPGILNRGLADADSVVLRLRPTGGSLTLVDSVVVFTDVPMNSLADQKPWVLCGDPADTTGLAATIVMEVYQDGGLLRVNDCEWDGSVGGGGGYSCSVSNLRAEAQDRGWMLRWDTDTGCPLEAGVYEIGNLDATVNFDWFATVPTEAACFEIALDSLYTAAGHELWTNEFGVRIVLGDNNPRAATTVRLYEGPSEYDGWPVLLPGTSMASPLVVDLSDFGFYGYGVAVFAGTDKIYGILQSPSGVAALDPSIPGGGGFLFYDPDGDPPEFGHQFVDAMAFGDFDPDPGPEIAANLFGDGLYMIGVRKNGTACCEPEFRWKVDLSEATGLGVEAPSPVVAITLDDGEESTSILFLAASNDRYVYAWEGNGTAYGNTSGQLFDIGHVDNPDALAIGYRTDDPETTEIDESGYELIVATSMGKVHFVPISATNPEALVSARGTWDSGSDVRLSTPAVGDVTGDGDNEVVVTAEDGTIYLLDENVMGLVASAADTGWYFEGQDPASPPVGPALADVDTDGKLEIFVFTATAGVGGTEDYNRALEQTLIRFDWDGSDLVATEASDAVPFSQRTFSTSSPVSTPVIGELDPDATGFRPDVLANATSGAVFGFESSSSALYSKDEGTNGWPLLHGSTVRGLTLTEFPVSWIEGRTSIVGMGEDGLVHAYTFDPADGDPSPVYLWPSEGFDLGNTRGNLSFGGSPRPVGGADALTVRQSQDRLGVVFSVAGGETGKTATLRIYDVAGRMLDQVDRKITTTAPVEIRWNGVTRNGMSLASGIYFYSVSVSDVDSPIGSGKIALVR
ncbi:MAG: hypothetical protein H6682_22710 [Candidatus Eisenbacteria bacterium]|nr:hypothetical protein [Candidatus Eisenbacteria bacterium]